MGAKLGSPDECKSKGSWKYGVEEDMWVYEEQGNRELEKTAYWGASPYVVLTKHNEDDHIKKDKMDRACGW